MTKAIKEQEVYPRYEDYADGIAWPSVEGREVRVTYVDEMAPQHASSAIWKLRRYIEKQWSTDMDFEREWATWQRYPLYRALAARASGIDDLSELFEEALGLDIRRAMHLIVRCIFEGAGEDEDPDHLYSAALRLANNLHKKGYVIVNKKS